VNWVVGSLGTATWASTASAWRVCPEALNTPSLEDCASRQAVRH
jgi:hypothetical protein